MQTKQNKKRDEGREGAIEIKRRGKKKKKEDREMKEGVKEKMVNSLTRMLADDRSSA